MKTHQGKGPLRLCWTPDLPDNRDHLYAAQWRNLARFRARLIAQTLPAGLQSGTNRSCTANAIAAAIEFDRKKQKLADFVPSRLFIYYNERSMEHSVSIDNGAEIRDGIKSVGKQGACPEREWSYPILRDSTTNVWPAGAKPAQRPPKSCYMDARKFPRPELSACRPHTHADERLSADGYPFVFGFTVYDSFESAEVEKTGVLNMPASREGVVGGHAVLAVGYDDKAQRFYSAQFVGRELGQKRLLHDALFLSAHGKSFGDFWTIRLVH